MHRSVASCTRVFVQIGAALVSHSYQPLEHFTLQALLCKTAMHTLTSARRVSEFNVLSVRVLLVSQGDHRLHKTLSGKELFA